MFKKLNFPDFDFQIKTVEDKLMIFDGLRKKFVRLTSEEWVRQHMLLFLLECKKYPKSLIKVESGLKYNKLNKRSDILTYDNTGQPFLVIECKSPEISLDKNVLYQVSAYAKSLEVKYIGVTNGLDHYFWELDINSENTVALRDFPEYKV